MHGHVDNGDYRRISIITPLHLFILSIPHFFMIVTGLRIEQVHPARMYD
jgi:hypothetical protein